MARQSKQQAKVVATAVCIFYAVIYSGITILQWHQISKFFGNAIWIFFLLFVVGLLLVYFAVYKIYPKWYFWYWKNQD